MCKASFLEFRIVRFDSSAVILCPLHSTSFESLKQGSLVVHHGCALLFSRNPLRGEASLLQFIVPPEVLAVFDPVEVVGKIETFYARRPCEGFAPEDFTQHEVSQYRSIDAL